MRDISSIYEKDFNKSGNLNELKSNAKTIVTNLQSNPVGKKIGHYTYRNSSLNWKEKINFGVICYQDRNNENIVHGRISISAISKNLKLKLKKAEDILFKITLAGNQTQIQFGEVSKSFLKQAGLKFIFNKIEKSINELSTDRTEYIKEEKKMNSKNWDGYYFKRSKIENKGHENFKEAIRYKIFSKAMYEDARDNGFTLHKYTKQK